MIEPIEDRATFLRLRKTKFVGRGEVLTIRFVPAHDPVPPDQARVRLASSISRKVGNAVVRNRLRRRLREIFRKMASEGTRLEPGAYLVITSTGAAGLSFGELDRDVVRALAVVARRRGL